MPRQKVRFSCPSIASEFYGAPLGDTRRNHRLERIVSAVSRRPDKSFPSIFKGKAELEGFYRFIEGNRYATDQIMEPHVQQTVQRIAAEKTVIVAHDTTEFQFKGEREGLGYLRGKSAQGFLGHFSLALSAETQRPLGVLAMRLWARTGEPRGRINGRRRCGADYANEPDKETERWWEAVDEVRARVGTSPVNVVDREGDAYPLLANMAQADLRFVVRLARDRVVGAEQAVGEQDLMSEVLTCAEIRAEREVPISRRQSTTIPKLKHFAVRRQRIARLSIRSTTVALQRPKYVSSELSDFVPVNVVHVIEIDTPKGEIPVEWKLLTNEPIETAEQVLAVVDYYRARWVIEEYFKAIKTGCALEKRQLESFETLSNALGIFIPIAWKLLELRTVARETPSVPATEVLTPTQVEVLRNCGPMPLSRSPTIREALLAIAKLGGHIRNNGEPGWQVLGRGFQELLMLELGWLAAIRASQERTRRRRKPQRKM